MRSHRIPLGLAAVGLAAWLAPATVLASARLDGIPEQVREGDRVEVRWSALDPDVEEVELELSVAGSRWVRISPEMEALEGRYVWRVTGGLAGPARIRLRAGGERGEREVASHAFTIVPQGIAKPAAILAWPDGWDLAERSGPAAAGALAAEHARYSLLVETPVAATSPSAGAESEEHRTPARESAHRFVLPTTGALRSFHAPRRTPLRN